VKADLLGLREHRLDQTRLADPERPGDEQRAAIRAHRTLQRMQGRSQFSLTPLDGRVEKPRRADRRAARELALKRQRLIRGLRAKLCELVAQQAELTNGSRPITARYASAHEPAVSLLVRCVLAQHLFPLAPGSQHREPSFPQPRARAKSPLLVTLVGQQLAAVRGFVAALKPPDVGDHLRGRCELDHPAPKHDGAPVTERAACVARGLVQIGRRRVGSEPRPEHLEHLIARHAMTGSEREKLHEIRRAPLRPRVSRYDP